MPGASVTVSPLGGLATFQPAVGDIAIAWDLQQGIGDWTIAQGDIGMGADIASAVFVSLFTDGRAGPEDRIPDGTDDPRGHWSDTYEDQPIGSKLWLLATVDTLAAKRYCEAALAWLVTDNIASSVNVTATKLGPGILGIAIAIARPSGAPLNLNLSLPWAGLASGPSFSTVFG